MARMLRSGLCRQAQHQSPEFRRWCERLHETHRLHRKQWEFCFIAQALDERGMLQPGRRGLGFGVGTEPLVALFASMGCEIVASDLDEQRAQEAGWVATNQHSKDLETLNQRGICPPELFRQRVTFRSVDMNNIPSDLRDFDFTWSSCSLEHVGSIHLGQRFVINQLDCLKPGGVGVHTTEFNVSSNEETLTHGGTVLFRRRDIEQLVRELKAANHRIDVDYAAGDGEFDQHIDVPPYGDHPHLKLQIAEYVSTSIGLIIEKDRAGMVHRLVNKLLRRRVA